MDIGIKECSKCENNIKCSECAYPEQNRLLLDELDENKRLLSAFTGAKLMGNLKNKTRNEAIKDFAYNLKIKMGFLNVAHNPDFIINIVDKLVAEMCGDSE